MKTHLLLILALVLAPPLHAQLAPYDGAGMTYGHVHLNVSDLELHKELWVEQFGGELVERGPLTVVKFPGMLIALRESEPTMPMAETVMDHFGFKVRDIEDVLDRWRRAGYEVQSEFTGAEGFPNAYLVAPDGILIELQEDTTQSEDVAGYHIHFRTAQYEELLGWYVEVFGAVPFQRGTIATTANVPGMNLSFGDSDTPRAATQGSAIDHIGFEFRNLRETVDRLESMGITFDVDYREIPAIGLNIAYLTDPTGVYIELTEGYTGY